MSYNQVFGGNTIYPSDVSYLPLAISADTTLQWPLEASTGSNLTARIIDVTPSTTGLSVIMPDATQTAPGQVTQFTNIGPSTITIKNSAGGTLLSIAAGLTFTLYLTSNATAAGTWRSFQAGASTAQAQASALAGFGIVAQGSLLAQSQPVVTFASNYTAGLADRASAYIWTGALGTLALSAASALGNNWFMSIRNAGTGNLTIAPGGSDVINGGSALTLHPSDSATINTDGTSFWTVGLGQDPVFAFDYTSIDLTGHSGTYTLSGSELNRIAYDFVGVLAGNVEIIVPATTQQYWVSNDTTGGSYTLSVGTATQVSPVVVVRGSRGIYYCQGSLVVNADTASIASPLGIADGGTGATTASGARINLGGTSTGIAVFTASSAATGRAALSAAASGANGDITSLTGLTTALTVPQGGTGAATFTAHGVLLGNGAGALAVTAAGTAGQVLTSNGAGADPTFQTAATGSVTSVAMSGGTTGLTFSGGPITSSGTFTCAGTLAVANGGTGITSLGTGVATALGQNVSGSGSIALTTSPTFVTPNLGVASATSYSGAALAGPAAATGVGYMGAPANTQNGNYTLALTDQGEMVYHTSATAHAYTIPPNSSVALPIGTVILIENEVSAGVITVTRGAGVSLFWRGSSVTSADRALAANGACAIKKVATDTWSITGVGLS